MGEIRVAVAVGFTLLPILFWLGYFYTRDARREPRAVLVATFLLGTAATLAAVVIESILIAVEGRSLGILAGAVYQAFAVAAVPEELLKLLVIACFCARRKSFDEPIDGVVYGATAALGFAAVENAMYVAQGGWIVAVMWSVTSVPMHAAMGAILGYYVAQQRLLLRRGAIWSGLAIAVLVHGLYDFGPMVLTRLGADEEALVEMGVQALGFLVLMIVVVVVTLAMVYRLVWRLRTEQVHSSGPGVSDGALSPPDGARPLVAHLLEHRAHDDASPAPAEEPPALGTGPPASDSSPPSW